MMFIFGIHHLLSFKVWKTVINFLVSIFFYHQIKSNAVRALGNLSRFVRCKSKSSSSDDLLLLERMVQAFLSCVITGNVKVLFPLHSIS